MDHGSAESTYTLEVQQREIPPGTPVAFRFRVVGPTSEPVVSYRLLHERELHLIVVRRDLSTFAHLHPTRDADGTWEVEMTLPSAGEYRAFADIAPTDGHDMTLEVDLTAPGDWEPRELPAASTKAQTDGYEVALSGSLSVGAHSELAFRVTRGGEGVELEPYLGALGHLVALRAADLAYLHVHPMESSISEAVRFGAMIPSDGLYRLFLQFQHAGDVHTAAFTVEATAPAT